jgi:hypothetical protein
VNLASHLLQHVLQLKYDDIIWLGTKLVLSRLRSSHSLSKNRPYKNILIKKENKTKVPENFNTIFLLHFLTRHCEEGSMPPLCIRCSRACVEERLKYIDACRTIGWKTVDVDKKISVTMILGGPWEAVPRTWGHQFVATSSPPQNVAAIDGPLSRKT